MSRWSSIQGVHFVSKNRVRTKDTNGRPPLRLSTLPPGEFNIRVGEEKSVLCRECRRSRRIIGNTTLKVIRHGADRGKQDPGAMCEGSNQLVVIDIDIAAWQRQQDRILRACEDAPLAESRRSTRQHHKPRPHSPAVTQIQVPPPDANDTLDTYRQHVKTCRASTTPGRCSGSHRCTEGARLAALYEQLNPRMQPYRDRQRQQDARVDALLERHRAATAPRRRVAQWAAVLPAVRQADAQRAEGIENAVPVRRHTDVPRKKPVRLGD